MKVANAAASLLLALILSLTAALGIAAAVNTNSPPSLMTRADYLAALRDSRDAGRLALGGCRELAGAEERAVCRAQARAEHSIAEARRLAPT